MTICSCSMAGTAACMRCPNNPMAGFDFFTRYNPWFAAKQEPIFANQLPQYNWKSGVY